MGFLHDMTCHTQGIARTAPVRWRSFEAMCGVFWEAEGKQDATGYYTAPDPRIMLFFNDVSEHIQVSDRACAPARPLLRALYVPAGTPMWTRFQAEHRFSHLDLHMKKSWLLARLTQALGANAALQVASQPAAMQESPALAALGETLKHEILRPERHPLFAESLALSLVTGLVDMPKPEAQIAHAGGLTPEQMRRLRALVEADPAAKLSHGVLAEAVGLSPSWFAHAFKKTTGKTPLQWLQEQRIARVKQSLLAGGVMIADLAGQLGFADQAHLTRVFRRHEGTTPAAWLRHKRQL